LGAEIGCYQYNALINASFNGRIVIIFRQIYSNISRESALYEVGNGSLALFFSLLENDSEKTCGGGNTIQCTCDSQIKQKSPFPPLGDDQKAKNATLKINSTRKEKEYASFKVSSLTRNPHVKHFMRLCCDPALKRSKSPLILPPKSACADNELERSAVLQLRPFMEGIFLLIPLVCRSYSSRQPQWPPKHIHPSSIAFREPPPPAKQRPAST